MSIQEIQPKKSISDRITFFSLFLLIGALSMLYAEVFSGASTIWFLTGWGLLVTFPLYMFHVLFYLNLAIRTRRTSIPQLYLWGILFALYEAPITKVLWAGYFGEVPLLGTVMGIAIMEFIVLVFFWHPLFSFVIPIVIFEILALNTADSNQQIILFNHTKFLSSSSRKSKIYFLALTFLAAGFVSGSTGATGGIILALLSVGGTIFLVFVFYFLAKAKNNQGFSIESLSLGKLGFSLVCIYMIGLYVVMFFILRPEGIPLNPLSIGAILGCYVLFIILILLTKPQSDQMVYVENPITTKFLYAHWLILMGLVIVLSLIPDVATIIFISLYLLIAPIGVVLFVYMLLKALFFETST
ncbi:MAG: hypothetical protein ACFFDI_22060 [Promethearchaeota archaeon]